MSTEYAVFCGIDVGKSEHHAVALTADGTRIYDRVLPNDETNCVRSSTGSPDTDQF